MQGLLAAALSHTSYSHTPGLQEMMSCQQLTGLMWQQEICACAQCIVLWVASYTGMCNVWDAYVGSAIPMATTAVPFYYNWFRSPYMDPRHYSMWV